MKKLLRRHLSLMLALRYLNPLRTMFSIITLICLGGVALGVMVLVVVLSVMSGLQREMESRVLAFTPHFLVSYYENGQRAALTETNARWPELVEKIKALPGVVTAYPQLESQSIADSRLSCVFRAIDSSNSEQMAALEPLLREGSFDFGTGLDEHAVLSMTTAKSLGLRVGDKVHLTPVGSLDEVAKIYTLIQKPLATHADEPFMKEIASLFDAEQGDGTASLPVTRVQAVRDRIRKFEPNQLRSGEYDELCALWDLSDSLLFSVHSGEVSVALTPDWKEAWQKHARALASLDRQKENGKAAESINELILPVDLTVIGIYQPPENILGPAVFVPLEIGQQMLGFNVDGNNAVQGIAVRVADPNNPGDLERLIAECLPPAATPSPDTPYGGGWVITPWQKSFESWFRLIANERTMMSFVLSFIALIASFCIMAVMFTVSMQRKREIAVLQALGATPAKIMRVFVWQGVIIGFAGALAGIGLALLVLHYRLEIQAFLAGLGLDPFPMEGHGITMPCHIEGGVLVSQALQAFVMVTVAATIPAFFVSRQDPSKALRAN